ncbi:MAG: hypothetical protein MZU95_01525 [Desulfomicrobium escambiense]|nr:hypothetical protein [Desulfomicrobium escambiense]
MTTDSAARPTSVEDMMTTARSGLTRRRFPASRPQVARSRKNLAGRILLTSATASDSDFRLRTAS